MANLQYSIHPLIHYLIQFDSNEFILILSNLIDEHDDDDDDDDDVCLMIQQQIDKPKDILTCVQIILLSNRCP